MLFNLFCNLHDNLYLFYSNNNKINLYHQTIRSLRVKAKTRKQAYAQSYQSNIRFQAETKCINNEEDGVIY